MSRIGDAWNRVGPGNGMLFLGGIWQASTSGREFSVIDPAHGTEIACVAEAGTEDVQLALRAARAALPEWCGMASWKRYRILRDAALMLEQDSEQLAVVLTAESGKPIAEARAEVRNTIRFLDWFSHETLRLPGQHWATILPDREMTVHAEPIGVVAAVTPWNFPGFLVACKIGAALAAGCTVILKPAEQTPLTALSIAKAFEMAGMPAGTLNVLPTSHPAVVGNALADAREVACISFTGSKEVGQRLLHKGAEGIKRVLLELGGNSPALVLEDADLDLAAKELVRARFGNSGQTCVAVNRVYAVRSVSEKLLERLCTLVHELRAEDPLLETCNLGPLIDMSAVERIEGQIEAAVAQGAQIRIGGKRIRKTDASAFIEPTVLVADAARQPAVLQEELFGPVMAVVVCKNEEEALSLANDAEYGLAGYIFAGDASHGDALARQLKVGTVGINRALVSEPQLPFGGMGGSGLGRERGRAGVEEFLETKTIQCGK